MNEERKSEGAASGGGGLAGTRCAVELPLEYVLGFPMIWEIFQYLIKPQFCLSLSKVFLV